MDEVKGRSFFFCILLHSNQFYSIPVPSCQVCWCEASLKSQRWEETTSSVKQCTWCETADDVWEALGQESESRDRLEQPSCAQQALASLESAAVWFCACVCMCVCVYVCVWVWVFACTSWEAQWAGADAPSSHSNSPNRVCYLCLSEAFRLPRFFLCSRSLGLSTSDALTFWYTVSGPCDTCSTSSTLSANPHLILSFSSTGIILSFLSKQWQL